MSALDLFLKEYSKKPNNKNVFSFGKYKGRDLTEIFETDPAYVAYCMAGDDKYFKRIKDFYMPMIEKKYSTHSFV